MEVTDPTMLTLHSITHSNSPAKAPLPFSQRSKEGTALRHCASLTCTHTIHITRQEPTKEDIVLKLTTNGLRLRFEPVGQRLSRVEVTDLSKLTLLYDGTVFRYTCNGAATCALFRLLPCP